MMRYAVIYDSPTGNTRILAEEIRRCMDGQNGNPEECICFGELGQEKAGAEMLAAAESEIVFAGFWTDKGDCSEKMAGFLESLHGQRVFLFGTAGFGGAKEYFRRILERVGTHLAPDNTVTGKYMCQGKMPLAVRKRYESMLEQNPEDERMRAMLENFDQALVHPDEADLELLRKSVSSAVDL